MKPQGAGAGSGTDNTYNNSNTSVAPTKSSTDFFATQRSSGGQNFAPGGWKPEVSKKKSFFEGFCPQGKDALVKVGLMTVADAMNPDVTVSSATSSHSSSSSGNSNSSSSSSRRKLLQSSRDTVSRVKTTATREISTSQDTNRQTRLQFLLNFIEDSYFCFPVQADASGFLVRFLNGGPGFLPKTRFRLFPWLLELFLTNIENFGEQFALVGHCLHAVELLLALDVSLARGQRAERRAVEEKYLERVALGARGGVAVPSLSSASGKEEEDASGEGEGKFCWKSGKFTSKFSTSSGN